jgi:leucyl-tRNA synthetase
MLSKAPAEWLYATAADGTRLKRETNTMPQWAGSCWYYLRFADPKNDKQFLDPAVEKHWLPVDLYVGGAEHAVLHLLYSRFWHKVLFDRGYVSTPEPFRRLVNQGMILGEVEFTGYVIGDSGDDQTGVALQSGNSNRRWVSVRDLIAGVDEEGVAMRIVEKTREAARPVPLAIEQVDKKGDAFVLKHEPSIVVDSRAYKMSKSRGNVINPDSVVQQFGADSLRLYEMFMGPLEAVKPWSMKGVEGVSRFLGRVWRMIMDEQPDAGSQLNASVQDVAPSMEQLRVLHRTIKAVTRDVESLGFNTAISRMMEFVNEFLSQDVRPKSAMESFVLLLSPFAPHIAEELWQALGHQQTLAYEPWPTFDEKYLVESQIEIPVQLNGKLRGKIVVPAQADQAAMEAAAKSDPTIAVQLAGKTIVKTVVVPGKMVNFVVR